jgi:hypothetical protein
VIAHELWAFRSHLIVHSDMAGWYVPIEFTYPLSSAVVEQLNTVIAGVIGNAIALIAQRASPCG